jgi:hypothetical protein
MKVLTSLIAGAAALACSAAHAATLQVSQSSASVFSFYLDGGSLNGNFNVVTFKAIAHPPAQFRNPSSGLSGGVPRPPGQALTYYNRQLNSDPFDIEGGLGWSVLGVTNTSSELSFTGGPLGQVITTEGQPGNRLFLANVDMTPGGQGTATVQLIQFGVLAQEITVPFPWPEPTGGSLAAIALPWGLAATRRRRV